MNNSIKKKTPDKSSFTRIIIDLESFKEKLDFSKNHGVCGSYNLGNTCFMNSSIACLSNCSELTEYFLSEDFESDINRKNVDGARGKLAEEWYKLLYYYWNIVVLQYCVSFCCTLFWIPFPFRSLSRVPYTVQ